MWGLTKPCRGNNLHHTSPGGKMSALNRIFEAGACAAAVCAGTSVARGRPGAQEMSLCSSRWHSSFESTLKPTCSQHLWRYHSVDTELTSWPPPILKGFRLFSCSLYSCLTQVFQWSSDLEGSTFSMLLPATMLDTQGAAGVCPVVLILCPATLSYPGQVCTHDPWSPSSSSNIYYRHFYCHQGRCCPLTQAKGHDV